MNLRTGLSIYNKPWLIEPNAAITLLDYWEKVKAGDIKWDYRAAKNSEEDTETRLPVTRQFFEQQQIIMAPSSSRELRRFEGFAGASVAIIPVMGPLMKSDYCGDLGTASMRALTMQARDTPGVQTIIFLHDSPGGTVDGTQAFADTIESCPQTTIAICDGLMCSADYWLASACDKIYAGAKTDIIGSIGTMVSMVDNTEAMKERGLVIREYYATASKDKNKMFDDALKGDGKALIEEHLDPTNDVFLEAVKGNRPDVKKGALSGKTFLAEQAIEMGLIDGIKTLDEVLAELQNPDNNIHTNHTNTIVMTIDQLKAQHPDLVKAVATEAVANERDRVGSWMSFIDIDAEAVKKGIESGAEVSRKDMSEFFVKQTSAATKKEIVEGNAPKVETPEPASQPDARKAEVNEFMANCAKEIGVKLPGQK